MQADSEYSQYFLPWSTTNYAGNKTRYLNSMKKAKTLTDTDLVTLSIMQKLLGIPDRKLNNLRNLLKSRHIQRYYRSL